MQLKQIKRKTGKRKYRSESRAVSVRTQIIQGVLGALAGAAAAFVLLAISSLAMKLTSSALTSAGGWVLALKLAAGLVAGFTAVRSSGAYLWLRGMMAGLAAMVIVHVVLALGKGFEPLCLLADMGLGAVCGLTAGCMQRIFKG